jgi:hypothetical protein
MQRGPEVYKVKASRHCVLCYCSRFTRATVNNFCAFTVYRPYISLFMVDAHCRTSCRRLFKKLEILTVPSQYMYSLISFLLGIKSSFRQICQCTALIQEINIIFIDRLQTCLVFREVHPTLGSEFLTACHKVLQILRMKRPSLEYP